MTLRPAKSARLTVWPVSSVRLKAGACSPGSSRAVTICSFVVMSAGLVPVPDTRSVRLVRTAGLEPAHLGHRNLNPACLPVPPRPLAGCAAPTVVGGGVVPREWYQARRPCLRHGTGTDEEVPHGRAGLHQCPGDRH